MAGRVSRPNLPRRVNDVLARMVLYQETGAIDYGRDTISTGRGGHGTHKERGVAPTLQDSMFVEWADRFNRLCAAAEKAADEFERGPDERRRRGETSHARKRRIVTAYVGLPLAEAAFIDGCSTDLVRKTRIAANRDPQDGTPLPKPEVREPYRQYESESKGNECTES